MNTGQIKQEIHDYINHADERFLRLIYSMVESEKIENDLFDISDIKMRERAEESLSSVNQGKTRSLHEFKSEIKSWKEKRNIQ